MMSKTKVHKINWLGGRGETWNPVTGCTPVSPGCDNCYAARMAQRQGAMAGSGMVFVGIFEPRSSRRHGEEMSILSAQTKGALKRWIMCPNLESSDLVKATLSKEEGVRWLRDPYSFIAKWLEDREAIRNLTDVEIRHIIWMVVDADICPRSRGTKEQCRKTCAHHWHYWFNRMRKSKGETPE